MFKFALIKFFQMLDSVIRSWKKPPDPEAMRRLEDVMLRGSVDEQQTTLHRASDVGTYYNEMTPTYLKGFGEAFQGARPSSFEGLLKYLARSAHLQDGQKVLDAGCGVCGPSVWFARHFDVQIEAVTISPVQVEEAKKRIGAAGLEGRVTVREGDFHKLSEYFPPASFDRIMFLESICHAENYRTVLREAMKVLKPGGRIYIKDYCAQDHRSRPERVEDQMADAVTMHKAYYIAFPKLHTMIEAITEVGLHVDYARQPTFEMDYDLWLKFELESDWRWVPRENDFTCDTYEFMLSAPVGQAFWPKDMYEDPEKI